MGHASVKALHAMSKGGVLRDLPDKLGVAETAEQAASALPPSTCEGCALGKAHRAPFGRERDPQSLATDPLECVSADICGPVVVRAHQTGDQLVRASLNREKGALYVSTIIDHASGRVWVQPIDHRSDAVGHVRAWLPLVERQTGRRVHEFVSDGGKEYEALSSFFRERGVRQTVVQKYTSQHNGVAERMDRART